MNKQEIEVRKDILTLQRLLKEDLEHALLIASINEAWLSCEKLDYINFLLKKSEILSNSIKIKLNQI